MIKLKMQVKELKNAIKVVAPSCIRSNKKNESVLLKCIHVIYDNKKLKFESTNRMSYASVVVEGDFFEVDTVGKFDFLASKKQLSDALKGVKGSEVATLFIDDDSKKVTLYHDEKNVILYDSGSLHYPGTKNIYNINECIYYLNVNKKQFIDECKKMNDDIITLKNDGKKILLNNNIVGETNVDFSIILNKKQFIKQLKTLKKDNVIIKTAGEYRPLVIEDDNIIQVLAPMRA